MSEKSYEEIGGRNKLIQYSKVFYDKVYAHPWLKLFFEGINQEVIEAQQVDFLQGALGGDKVYCGKMPIPAHLHMNITEELFEVRNQLVEESLKEVFASPEMTERVIRIDNAFKTGMIKKTLADCQKRFPTQEIMDFKKP